MTDAELHTALADVARIARRGGYDVNEEAEVLARVVRDFAADQLCAMADGTRSTEILFRRNDGSGVRFNDLLRERAANLREGEAVR